MESQEKWTRKPPGSFWYKTQTSTPLLLEQALQAFFQLILDLGLDFRFNFLFRRFTDHNLKIKGILQVAEWAFDPYRHDKVADLGQAAPSFQGLYKAALAR
ncbi:MAG: hypothetical protein Q8R42_09300 [Desulfocapsaceae bacterium]|nr:hypothetical protein [Desulfocapsaceae bacterium]